MRSIFFLFVSIWISFAIYPSFDAAWAADNFYVIPFTATTFKENWSISQTYSAHDVVFYNGSSWFSLRGANKGNQPGQSPNDWTLLAQKGADGTNGTNGRDGATGATGPQGPVGPSVKTSAVCASAANGDGDCSCNKTLVSKVKGAPCNATSETGSCVANGYSSTSGGITRQYYGACCVCAPN